MSVLSNTVAIVTGGSRGVGKGAALGLGEAGATVYVTARTQKPGDSNFAGSLAETIADINAAGGKGVALPCDHGDDAAVKKAIAQVISRHGQLDILVNNVFSLPADLTLWSQGKFWQQPLSMWDDQINIGLRSHYVASHYAAPQMIAQGHGLIVNISSSGARDYHMNVAYGAGKAGLDKLSLDMAEELKEHNVTVLSLWPGLVATERIIDTMGQENLDGIGFETPTFTGRAIAALAAEKNSMRRSGQRFIVAELAAELGFTDVNGTIPNAHTYLEET